MKSFFIDNCLPPKAAAALAAIWGDRMRICHLKELFSEDTADEEWMTRLAGDREHDWCVVTRDRRIAKNKKEQQIWRKTGLLVFFLDRGWQKMDAETQCVKLVYLWHQFMENADSASRKGAAGFTVRISGKMDRIF